MTISQAKPLCLALVTLLSCAQSPPAREIERSPAQAAQAVLARNLMGTRRDVAPTTPAAAELAPCSVASDLAGVIVDDSGGYAVLREGPRIGFYGPGATLPNGATVVEVKRAELLLRHGQRAERCSLWTLDDTGSTGGAQVIDAALVQWAQTHMHELMNDARIVPSFSGDSTAGFKLFSIRPGSLYERIGLQNGDVIEAINGYELNSPGAALEVYGKVREARSLQVRLKRRGERQTLSYEIR